MLLQIKGLGYANTPLSKLTYTFPSKLSDYQHLFYLYKVDCSSSGVSVLSIYHSAHNQVCICHYVMDFNS